MQVRIEKGNEMLFVSLPSCTSNDATIQVNYVIERMKKMC